VAGGIRYLYVRFHGEEAEDAKGPEGKKEAIDKIPPLPKAILTPPEPMTPSPCHRAPGDLRL